MFNLKARLSFCREDWCWYLEHNNVKYRYDDYYEAQEHLQSILMELYNE